MANVSISEITQEITSASELDGNELFLISDVNNSTYTSKKCNLGNIKNYVGTTINNQEKTVSPSTSSQDVTPDTDYTGLSKVTVSAVTNSIDSNISAGNIKKDVSILGVTGTYSGEGTIIPTSTEEVANGFRLDVVSNSDHTLALGIPITSNTISAKLDGIKIKCNGKSGGAYTCDRSLLTNCYIILSSFDNMISIENNYLKIHNGTSNGFKILASAVKNTIIECNDGTIYTSNGSTWTQS